MATQVDTRGNVWTFPIRVPPTDWAQRYGLLSAGLEAPNDQLFRPFGKSAFTPTTPAHKLAHTDIRRRREDHFRMLHHMFTPKILEALHALPWRENHQMAHLTNDIHPIFHYANWQTKAQFDSGDDPREIFPLVLPGDTRFANNEPEDNHQWAASNPAVWKRLLPILRLCTRFLGHTKSLRWIDALINGARTDVPDRWDRRDPNVKQTKGPRKYFHTRVRNDITSAETAVMLRQHFNTIGQKINFSICSAQYLRHQSNTVPRDDWYGAVTTPHINSLTKERHICIEITWQVLLPLFRIDLNPAEQMCLHFHIAALILHEFAHALGQTIGTEGNDVACHQELAFGGRLLPNDTMEGAEGFVELGYSFANALFGGSCLAILNSTKTILGAPPVAITLNTQVPAGLGGYPPDIFLHDAGTDIRQNFPPISFRAITCPYYEDIHNDKFWDILPEAFGPSIMAPTPGPLSFYLTDPTTMVHAQGGIQKSWMAKVDAATANLTIDDLANMDPAQREAYNRAKRGRDKNNAQNDLFIYYTQRMDITLDVVQAQGQVEQMFKINNPDRPTLSHKLQIYIEALHTDAKHECAAAFEHIGQRHHSQVLSFVHKVITNKLRETNRHTRELAIKAEADCEHFAMTENIRNFARKVVNLLFVVHHALQFQVKPGANETMDDWVTRIFPTIDPNVRRDHDLAEDDTREARIEEEDHLDALEAADRAWDAKDNKELHAIGLSIMGVMTVNRFWRAMGMSLIATNPEEPRGMFLAKEGVRILTELKALHESGVEPLPEVHFEFLELATDRSNEILKAWEEKAEKDDIEAICLTRLQDFSF